MNKGRRERTSGTRQRAAAKRRRRDAEEDDNDVYFVPSSSSSSSSSDVDEGGGRNTMQQPSQSSSIDDLLYGDIFAHGKRNKRRDATTTQEDTNATTERVTTSKLEDTIQTIDIDNIKSSASSREVSKSHTPHAQSESVVIYSGGSAEAMPQPQPSPTPRSLEELRRMSSMEVRARLTNFFNKKDSCATHFAQATAQLFDTTEGTSNNALEVTKEDPASNTSMSVSAQRQRDRAARLVNVSNWDSGADAVNDVLLPAALVPQSSYYTTTSHTTRNNNNTSNEQLVTSTSSTTTTALSGRTLRPHQIAGIRFLWSILAEGPVGQVPAVGCILAHTMGLGKTAQVIVFLHLFLAYFAPRPNATRPTPFINSAFDIKDEGDDEGQNAYRPQRVLIVVPKSTLPGWTDEFTRWSAAFPLPYRITPRTLEGAKPGQRVALYRQWRREGGVLLVGYEALVKLLQLLEEDEVLAQAESTQLFGLAGHRKPSRRSGRTHDTTNSNAASPMQLAVSARQAMRARHNDEGNMIYGSVDDPFTELVICDEAHRLKSVHLRVVTALRGLHPLRRLLLTGTPLQNHLGEYWAMVDFAVHGYFDRRRFRDFFVQPIESSLDRRASAREVDEARKKTFTLIREVRHFVQRVDSTPLRQELPPLYEYICVLPLSALQKELYLRFLATVQRSGGDGFQFLPAVSIAGKIAAHPQLLFNLHERQQKGQPRKNIEEAKGDEEVTTIAEPGSPLEEDEDEITQLVHLSLSQTQRFVQYDELCKPPRGGYVPQLQDGVKLYVALRLMQAAKRMNEKTLMFSLSTALLDFMEKLIAEANQQVALPADMIRYSRLDGSHTSAQRAVLLRDFNANAGPDVFLLSMKAGGIGVTITSATRVILVDTSFNPADDQQAIGRAYRYGQMKPVYVYRLLCYQTLEYSIFEQKLAKEWLFKTVVEETTVKRDRLSGMHVKEVLALLNRAGKALRRPAEATAAQAQATRAVLQEDPLLHAVQAELLYAQPYGTFLEDDHDDQYGEAEQQYYREFQRNMLFDLAGSDAADARAEAEAAELARLRRAAEMQQQARTLTSMVDDLIRSGAGSNPQLTRLLSAMGLQIDPVSGHLRNMSQTTSTPQIKADNDSGSGVVANTSGASRPAVVAGVTKSRVPAVEKAAPVKAEQRVESTHTNPPPVILVDSDEDSTAPASQGVLVDPARYAPFRPGASSSNAIDIDSTQ